MENFGSKVAAEKAPGGAISCRADVMLVAVHDSSRLGSHRAIGENSPVLNKCFVSQRVVSDEDGGTSTEGEGNKGTMLGLQSPEYRFQIGGPPKPKQVADEWKRSRSRRERKLFGGKEDVED